MFRKVIFIFSFVTPYDSFAIRLPRNSVSLFPDGVCAFKGVHTVLCIQQNVDCYWFDKSRFRGRQGRHRVYARAGQRIYGMMN
jgi:hypothetical protein